MWSGAAAGKGGNGSSKGRQTPCAQRQLERMLQGGGRRASGGKRRRTAAGWVPGNGGAQTQRKKGQGDGGACGELTEGSNRPEDGRRSGLNGEGRSSGRTAMAAAVETLNSAGKTARLSLRRGGEGSGQGWGGRDARNRAGRRGVAGATPAAVAARSARLELEEEEGDGDEKHPGSRADKGDAARRARIAGAHDTWSCRRSIAVWASTNRESTVILLTDFYSTLTTQNSNFHIET